MLVRIPSKSNVKRSPVEAALTEVWPNRTFEIRCLPVELQDRPDLSFNAQPEGLELTVSYAEARGDEMCAQHGHTQGIDVLVESGVILGQDVAVVVIRTHDNQKVTTLSQGIDFPDGCLEEARRRGFKHVTVGDVVHERHPEAPSNNWQPLYPPYITREEQIRRAVVEGLRELEF
jgi:non-canonical (house-cleaning) NTP pyrophosphatase